MIDHIGPVCGQDQAGKAGDEGMPVSVGMSLLIILAVALTTFATRVVPFLIFPKGKEIPPVIQYLGRVLTPAVIGLL